MMGHLQGQAAKLHLSVINPLALSPGVAAAPSGQETKVEGGSPAMEHKPILQTESPG